MDVDLLINFLFLYIKISSWSLSICVYLYLVTKKKLLLKKQKKTYLLRNQLCHNIGCTFFLLLFLVINITKHNYKGKHI
jgi:hypothetical protein